MENANKLDYYNSIYRYSFRYLKRKNGMWDFHWNSLRNDMHTGQLHAVFNFFYFSSIPFAHCGLKIWKRTKLNQIRSHGLTNYYYQIQFWMISLHNRHIMDQKLLHLYLVWLAYKVEHNRLPDRSVQHLYAMHTLLCCCCCCCLYLAFILVQHNFSIDWSIIQFVRYLIHYTLS